MSEELPPERVIPAQLAKAVRDLPIWFVIGGQAVRCFCPYRPSRDVDFGVGTIKQLDALVAHLSRSGTLEITERSRGTVHGRWNGIDVSIFVLPLLRAHVTNRRLDVTGILGTKLHAILDRGTRRDFFDLYVTLQHHQLGIVSCMQAIRSVYKQDVNEELLLRALTYFDDADREARLPGEGRRDWETVKNYFLTLVGSLLVPPRSRLAIQKRVVDVVSAPTPKMPREPRRKRVARK